MSGFIEQLIALAIISAFGFLYARMNSVVILPGLMFGALITRFIGLDLYEPLIALAPLTAALIVFIAGLEIDMDFLTSVRRQILLTILFEYLMLLSIIYLLFIYVSPVAAYLVAALTVASNEAFALDASEIPFIRKYGILLSVMEDSIAVFLLAIGFYTSITFTHLTTEMYRLIALTIIIIIFLLLFARPFSNLINRIEHVEAKVLITLLYIFILILISESLELPEALIVFLGAVIINYFGYDKELAEWMHSYMYLALMGFVVSLPYLMDVALDTGLFITSLFLGFVFGMAAYLLRIVLLYISLSLAGLGIDNTLALSLSMANSGEFGLIVLLGLTMQNLIPPYIYFIALFGYAFNLTIVSHVTINIEYFVPRVKAFLPNKILYIFDSLGQEINSFLDSYLGDRVSRIRLYQLVILVALGYFVYFMVHLVPSELIIVKYILYSIIFSVGMAAIYLSLRGFILRHFVNREGGIAPIIFEIIVLYVMLTPIIESIREIIIAEGGLLNPVPIFMVGVIISGIILELTYIIIRIIRLRR